MKKEITIPVSKQEDMAALKLRRENYATKRDIQATEFNDAIAKRLLAEAKSVIKCNKCGKEFETARTEETSMSCPACAVEK